jgi:hypothetical protein
LIKNAIRMLFLAVFVTAGGLCLLPPHGTDAAPPTKCRFLGLDKHPIAFVPHTRQFYQDYVSDKKLHDYQ